MGKTEKFSMKRFVQMAVESEQIDEKKKEETFQNILKKVRGKNYKLSKKK